MRIYLALGSNQGDRHALLDRATTLVAEQIGAIVAQSPRYETEPEGFVSSFAFVNAVIAVETRLSPRQVLVATQGIERTLGRQHKSIGGQYTDRLIDLDLLLYGALRYDSLELTIPHPRMHERSFVLIPLADIAPESIHPSLGCSIRELLEAL